MQSSQVRAQSARDWLFRAIDAREDAVRAKADCQVAVEDAIRALGDVRERAANLEAGGAITRQELLNLGLAAAYERQWQMHHKMCEASQRWNDAEDDWWWAWDHCRHGRGPWLVSVWDDVRDAYESAWVLALDELAWCEATSQWLDDHEDQISERGYK